ncbi:MAG: hypothetical protein ACRDAO_06890 [Culicoidibacterales bacterium]
MKTTTIQAEITQLCEHAYTIQELLTTHTDNHSYESINFDQIKQYADQISYNEHPMRMLPQRFQQLYCLFLATVVREAQEPNVNQLVLFQRLTSALQVKEPLLVLLESAQQIDMQLLDELLPFFQHYPRTKYSFIIDALVLSCCDTPTKSVLHYLAELATIFHIPVTELQIITDLVGIILQADSHVFQAQFNRLSHYLDLVIYYTKHFVDGLLVANEHAFMFSTSKQTPFPSHYVHITSKYVSITGALFDFNALETPVVAKGCERIAFHNCIVTTSAPVNLINAFTFTNCLDVTWSQCEFKQLTIQTTHSPNFFVYKNVKSVTMAQCTIYENNFILDLGEVKPNVQTKIELFPITGAFIQATEVETATFDTVSVTDTHTQFLFSTQNVLFGGTDFKKRQRMDAAIDSLITGFSQITWHNITHISSAPLQQ